MLNLFNTTAQKNHIITQSIIDIVCNHTQLDPKYLYMKSREEKLVRTRMYIAYLLRTVFGFNLMRIAKVLQKDHSNIHHYLNKIEDEKFLYKDVRETLEKLTLQAEEIKSILA